VSDRPSRPRTSNRAGHYPVECEHCETGKQAAVTVGPSHAEVEGNEVADRMPKEAAAGELYGDSESRRFQSRTSMAYLKRRATEAKTRGTKVWIAGRTKRRRSYIPPKNTGFRKELKGERKAIASRYYQLLTGHALIAPFLNEKLKKTDSDQCWWREAGKRQTRDHLFKEYGRWKTEINVLWTSIGKKLGWKHRRVRVVQGGERNGGDFAVPEGHRYRKNQEWRLPLPDCDDDVGSVTSERERR